MTQTELAFLVNNSHNRFQVPVLSDRVRIFLWQVQKFFDRRSRVGLLFAVLVLAYVGLSIAQATLCGGLFMCDTRPFHVVFPAYMFLMLFFDDPMRLNYFVLFVASGLFYAAAAYDMGRSVEAAAVALYAKLRKPAFSKFRVPSAALPALPSGKRILRGAV